MTGSTGTVNTTQMAALIAFWYLADRPEDWESAVAPAHGGRARNEGKKYSRMNRILSATSEHLNRAIPWQGKRRVAREQEIAMAMN